LSAQSARKRLSLLLTPFLPSRRTRNWMLETCRKSVACVLVYALLATTMPAVADTNGSLPFHAAQRFADVMAAPPHRRVANSLQDPVESPTPHLAVAPVSARLRHSRVIGTSTMGASLGFTSRAMMAPPLPQTQSVSIFGPKRYIRRPVHPTSTRILFRCLPESSARSTCIFKAAMPREGGFHREQ
jgi:hypothetical protein